VIIPTYLNIKLKKTTRDIEKLIYIYIYIYIAHTHHSEFKKNMHGTYRFFDFIWLILAMINLSEFVQKIKYNNQQSCPFFDKKVY